MDIAVGQANSTHFRILDGENLKLELLIFELVIRFLRNLGEGVFSREERRKAVARGWLPESTTCRRGRAPPRRTFRRAGGGERHLHRRNQVVDEELDGVCKQQLDHRDQDHCCHWGF